MMKQQRAIPLEQEYLQQIHMLTRLQPLANMLCSIWNAYESTSRTDGALRFAHPEGLCRRYVWLGDPYIACRLCKTGLDRSPCSYGFVSMRHAVLWSPIHAAWIQSKYCPFPAMVDLVSFPPREHAFLGRYFPISLSASPVVFNMSPRAFSCHL